MATQRVLVRQEAPEDVAAVRNVVWLAFGQEDEALLVDRLREAEGFDPRLSLVAQVGGEIVGHVLFTHVVIKADERETPALSLAPLAVRPDNQRQGIGQLLTRRGLDVARELGHRVVVVVGHPAYYPRFGFVPALPLGIEDPFAERSEASMVVGLVEGALDGLSGEVVYPPEFY